MEKEAATNNGLPSWMRFVVGKNPVWTLLRVIILILVTVVLFKFVLIPIRVTGDSMSPTFNNGQIKFVNKLAYLHKAPQHGDIVAAEFEGRQILLLKRVIAIPGDKFQVRKGDVYLNDHKIEEPYANGKISTITGRGYGNMNVPAVLGADEYLIIGDNRRV